MEQNPFHTQETRVYKYLGRVAEPLKDKDVTIPVIVPELTPNVSGSFGASTEKDTASLQNPQTAVQTQSQVNLANHIVATWFGCSNRRWPPYVRKGEQVWIYQFGDSDHYFWHEIGRDPEIRQLERYRLEVGNTQTPNQEKTEENTYYFELDTVGKRVRIHTTVSDGEPFLYEFTIDTANGAVTLLDSKGNRIFIDSKENQIQLNNADGTVANLNKVDMTLAAPRDIMIRAGRQIVNQSPVYTGLHTEGDGVVRLDTKGVSVDAANAVVFDSSVFGVQADTKINGNVVTGPMRAASYSTGSPGSPYKKPTTSLPQGTGNSAQQAADTDTAGSSNRQAAAWEQVDPALRLIKQLMDTIESQEDSINLGGRQNELIGLAQNSRMGINRAR